MQTLSNKVQDSMGPVESECLAVFEKAFEAEFNSFLSLHQPRVQASTRWFYHAGTRLVWQHGREDGGCPYPRYLGRQGCHSESHRDYRLRFGFTLVPFGNAGVAEGRHLGPRVHVRMSRNCVRFCADLDNLAAFLRPSSSHVDRSISFTTTVLRISLSLLGAPPRNCNRGVVDKIGPAVTTLKPGDKVVVSFQIACGTCKYCQKKFSSMCDKTNNSSLMANMYGRKLLLL